MDRTDHAAKLAEEESSIALEHAQIQNQLMVEVTVLDLAVNQLHVTPTAVQVMQMEVACSLLAHLQLLCIDMR